MVDLGAVVVGFGADEMAWGLTAGLWRFESKPLGLLTAGFGDGEAVVFCGVDAGLFFRRDVAAAEARWSFMAGLEAMRGLGSGAALAGAGRSSSESS